MFVPVEKVYDIKPILMKLLSSRKNMFVILF